MVIHVTVDIQKTSTINGSSLVRGEKEQITLKDSIHSQPKTLKKRHR